MAGFGLGEVAVVDVDRAVLFVASASGGIDAIAPDTGERRWHTDEADLPLAASDGALVAWDAADPRVVRVVWLDPATGAVVSRCADRPVPTGRSLDLHLPLGGQSWILGRFEPAGAALAWGGSFQAVTGTEQLAAAAPARDPAWSDRGRCDRSGRWTFEVGPPQPIGLGPPVGHAVTVDPSGGTWRVRAPDHELALAPFDPAAGAYGTVSADGAAVAVVRQVPTTAGTAYDARSGEGIGPFPALGPYWVHLAGGYVFATDGAIVGASPTGEIRWTAPALSRGYDGPVPP